MEGQSERANFEIIVDEDGDRERNAPEERHKWRQRSLKKFDCWSTETTWVKSLVELMPNIALLEERIFKDQLKTIVN